MPDSAQQQAASIVASRLPSSRAGFGAVKGPGAVGERPPDRNAIVFATNDVTPRFPARSSCG
ncbi:hypothetical protein KCP73_13715 [Salmonella enterica subsp. enterica]|nr:hypothetical protein KCP73_13715 [Salmonella enterica subsp. enterica]